MIDGKLVNLREQGIDPVKYAVEMGDFLSFNTAEEADQFSKMFSEMIGRSRSAERPAQGNSRDVF